MSGPTPPRGRQPAVVSGHGTRGYWIHLDADVLDDRIMPAVDYRMPNGLSWTEIEIVLRIALDHSKAVGMQVTILNPMLDADGSIVRAFVGILSRCLAKH